MRIFFLCKRFYTNKDLLADRFGRLFHLPVHLRACGATVHVRAMDYRNRGAEIVEYDGVEFQTQPATLRQLPQVPLKLRDALAKARPDVVIASGDSHIGYLGLRLARSVNAKFVFDVYDYYPTFSSNRIPGMKHMFWKATAGASLVLCASVSLQEAVSKANARNVLVQNGVDRDLFHPIDKYEARKAARLDLTGPIVGYFGSIIPSRGPLLIKACGMLRQEIPSLHLLLAGHVHEVNVKAPWITYRGEVSQSSIPVLINCCDVVTIPYADDEFNRMSGPCKVAEYLACAKPIVATGALGLEQAFLGTRQSLCNPDARSIAVAIKRQLEQPEVLPFPEHMAWHSIGHQLWEFLTSNTKHTRSLGQPGERC